MDRPLTAGAPVDGHSGGVHASPETPAEVGARRARQYLDLAERIAANAPISVRRMKETAVKGLDLPLAAALRLDVGPNPYLSEDRQEGIAARLEKRPPRWTGR